VAILKSPDIDAKVRAQYAIPVFDTAEQFDKTIRDETAHLTEVFRDITN